MYQAAAIDADGDIWGQKQDGTWVMLSRDEDTSCVGAEENIQAVSARFGPVATAALIPVEE